MASKITAHISIVCQRKKMQESYNELEKKIQLKRETGQPVVMQEDLLNGQHTEPLFHKKKKKF